MQKVSVVLYDDFTALDVFGPVEVLGNIDRCEIQYVSVNGGMIQNAQGIKIMTEQFSVVEANEILLVPGGFGSRKIIDDDRFIAQLGRLIRLSKYTLCVCTGSALAAKTGLLRGKNATSNKTAFEWVKSIDPSVNWNRDARWVKDGNIYTSAGVSAGTDMAVGFIRDIFGMSKAQEICSKMEYHWNSNAEHDLF